MTSAFADTQGHALGTHAPAMPAPAPAPTLRGAPWAVLAVSLFAGLLLLGALLVTVGPQAHLRVARASALGQGAVTSTQALRSFRAEEIGAGQVAITSTQALRSFRAEEIGAGQVAITSAQGLRSFRAGEIAQGSSTAVDPAIRFAKAHAAPHATSVAATPFADQGYRDQRTGEIGAASGGAAGRSHGK